MTDQRKTVTMEALERHTYHGQAYKVGATYECDEGDVETVEAQGKAKRVQKSAYKTTAAAAQRTTALTPGTKARPTTPAKPTNPTKRNKR